MPDRTAEWISRIWREFHAGNLTHMQRDVLLRLAGYIRAGAGRAWPSHATLAEHARCSVSTAQRALRAAAELGMVAWNARRVRLAWRSLRTSNLYRLLLPDTAPPATAGQRYRGIGERRKQEAHETRGWRRLRPQPPARSVAEQIAFCLAVAKPP